jgi:hypothetical protein
MLKAIRIASSKTPGSAHNKPISKMNSRYDNVFDDKLDKHVKFSDTLIEIIPSDLEFSLTDQDCNHIKKIIKPNHSTLHSNPNIIPPPLSKLAVDIKGPINIADTSHNAKKYALIFTCTTTRFRFVAFLKAKDEATKYTQKLLNYIR